MNVTAASISTTIKRFEKNCLSDSEINGHLNKIIEIINNELVL